MTRQKYRLRSTLSTDHSVGIFETFLNGKINDVRRIEEVLSKSELNLAKVLTIFTRATKEQNYCLNSQVKPII